jgi:hypothetical protein
MDPKKKTPPTPPRAEKKPAPKPMSAEVKPKPPTKPEK